MWTDIAHSVYELATGWKVSGGGGEFFAPVLTGSGAHPATYAMRTASFAGGNLAGRGMGHPPKTTATSGPLCPVLG